jgi:hypothetical protein
VRAVAVRKLLELDLAKRAESAIVDGRLQFADESDFFLQSIDLQTHQTSMLAFE